MNQKSHKTFFTRKKLSLTVLVLIIILAISYFISQLFYHADETLLIALDSRTDLQVTETSSYYAFASTTLETATGFILYPGALVDAEAYAPLMAKLAEAGYTSFIAKMPFNLAIFKGDAATSIIEDYPAIQNWYIGGHSLGGVMAASYVNKHPDFIKGIAFLASYPNKSLQDQDIKVISLYGTNDQVLNMTSYQEAQDLLPADAAHFTEIIIPGGNHAGFGNYGPQSGDGSATISQDKQQSLTADAIINFMDYAH